MSGFPGLDAFNALVEAVTAYRQARVKRGKASSRLEEAERQLGSGRTKQTDREELRRERRSLEDELARMDRQIKTLHQQMEATAKEVWDEVCCSLQAENAALLRDFDTQIVNPILQAGRAWREIWRRASDLQDRSRTLASLGEDLDRRAPMVRLLPVSKHRPSEALVDVLYRLKYGGIETDEPLDDGG